LTMSLWPIIVFAVRAVPYRCSILVVAAKQKVNRNCFCFPARGTIRGGVAFHPIKWLGEIELRLEFKCALKLFDLFFGSPPFTRKVEYFVFEVEDAPVQFDVVEFLYKFGDFFDIFDRAHLFTSREIDRILACDRIKVIAPGARAFEFAGAPSLRLLQGWGFLGLRLCDDRNLDLRGFAFDWDGLFRLLQALDVTADGVLGHGSRVLQILAFRHKFREGGDRHRVAAVFVRLEKGGLFVLHAPAAFHLIILDRNPNHALSF